MNIALKTTFIFGFLLFCTFSNGQDNNEQLWVGRYRYGGFQFGGHIGEIVIRDTGIDVAQHTTDLKRWLKKETEAVIELLSLDVPGDPLHVCTYTDQIDVTVYG